MTINVIEHVRKMMGWCPNASMLNKKEEEYMVSYEGKYIDKIKGLGFTGVLGVVHLVLGVWLIVTALSILSKPQIFPWWIMDINIFSSGMLLVVGITSLMVFFSFNKEANIHRILALVNIVFIAGFYIYQIQFMVLQDKLIYRLHDNFLFGFVTLTIFSLIVGMPSILTLFSKPVGVRKKRFFPAILLVLVIVLASIGAYYLYLNNQKDTLLVEKFGENGEYKLYNYEDGISWGNPYFLDSPGDTSGHGVTEDTINAIKFLINKEPANVMGWWDFELEIKAAGKEPVISYASEAIKLTVARPAALYDTYEPDEKVADVSRFFTTDSEDEAKTIAEKYGAGYVYYPRNRNYLFPVMLFAADPDYMKKQNTQSPEEYFNLLYSRSMANKFETGAELQHFDKIFGNDDVYIYQLK